MIARVSCILVVAGAMASQASAAPATTQSARAQTVRAWLADLADPVDAVRERARFELMGLAREELPLLRRVLAEAAPLQAAQRLVLRDIVTHVYLSGEDYERTQTGFLGVTMPREIDATSDDGESEPVIVESRLAGFCSYRMLQNGDLIVAVEGKPLRGRADLIYTVSALRPGARIEITVLRQGRTLKCPVTLDARPAAAEAARAQSIDLFRAEREGEADTYWQRHFADLVNARIL